MTKRVVSNIAPLTCRAKLVDGGFRGYARQFLSAYTLVSSATGFNPVRYYLCCHALELGLKAYLIEHGEQVSELKKHVGHDLSKAFSRASAGNLGDVVSIKPEYKQEIERANKYYRGKGFEYFYLNEALKGHNALPDLDLLREFATLLAEKD